MSGLRLVNIAKSFGDFKAIDDLNLEIGDGEFVTLLGPSGCGKTTTLRTIAGFYVPDAGEVYIKERLVNDIPPSRRNTGMCFQSYALFPHMSVFDNVRFGLRMRGVSFDEQKRRVDDALRMVELEQLGARKPAELSGGQQQRVALARAIVIEPDVLLFDEPLSNLDAKLRESVRVEIRNLQKRLGITAVYVTHDQAEALVISDRVVIMNHGKIEQTGDPHWVYNNPKTSFVAGFIGIANIRRGRVTSASAAGCTITTDFGDLRVPSTSLLVGDEVSVSFRPEDIVISATPGPNTYRGRVQQSIFMGNLTDLFIEVKGGLFRAQMGKGRAYAAGDEIVFGIPEDAVRILDREVAG